jgi:hypothetical protein
MPLVRIDQMHSLSSLRLAVVIIAVLLSGCLPHEGTYLPGCIAYVGDKITLGDGQFVWEKFTDERSVNEQGEIIDPFPGYPMKGSYRIDGQTVHLVPESGAAPQPMYLQDEGGRHYLLTVDEFAAWEATGSYAECALLLISENGS